MQVKAIAKNIKLSPKKIRLVVDVIRGMDVVYALGYLEYVKKRAAYPLIKLLNQVLADAKNNFQLDKNNLFISKIFVDKGPVIKRWRARAFGKAAPILRKSSHITVILEEKVPTARKTKKIIKKKNLSEEPRFKRQGKTEEVIGVPVIKKSEQANELPEKKIFDVRRKGKHRTNQNLDKLKKRDKRGKLKRIFRRKAI